MSPNRFTPFLLLSLACALACEDRPSSDVRQERTVVPAQPTTATETIAAAPLAPPAAAVYEPAPAHPWDGQPGSEMPAYTAQTLDGATVNLADLRGQPVLLNFWATWCVPCRLEFEELSDLHTRLGASGLQVIGVSLDHRVSPPEIATFARSQPINYTLWHDASGEVATFGVPPLPGNFVFDRQGRLAYAAIGAPPGSLEALAASVEQVVAAP